MSYNMKSEMRFSAKPRSNGRGGLWTLAILALLLTAVALTVVPGLVFAASEPPSIIRIGLVSGVGTKAELTVTSVSNLALTVTPLPTTSLATLAPGTYTLKPYVKAALVSPEDYGAWVSVPQALQQQGVPLVSSTGIKVLYPQTIPGGPELLQPSVSVNITGVAVYLGTELKAVLESRIGAIGSAFESASTPGYGDAGSSASALKLGTLSYRGLLAFEVNNGLMTPINHLDIEAYLYGVVPKEISPAWPVEAIKAQAVAARTYAYSGLGRFKAKGYDLTDDTLSQMYRGYGVEDPRSNAAVDATKGQCAYHNGRRIDALFHSNSGGYTENSENVFSNALPYLRGKEDPYSVGAPNDLWVLSYTPEQIEGLLAKRGYQVGQVQQVVSRSVSPNGRVLKLEIGGSLKTVVLEKEQMRSVFGTTAMKSLLFNVSKGDKMSVLSSGGLSQLTPGALVVRGAQGDVVLSGARILGGAQIDLGGRVDAPTGGQSSGDTYRFVGRGYGHGVGLSQYGAKKMAELGFTYGDILKFYYTDIVVE